MTEELLNNINNKYDNTTAKMTNLNKKSISHNVNINAKNQNITSSKF